MTRGEWESVLFEHVTDETAQDTLNEYVLKIEAENAKLQELIRGLIAICDGSVDYAVQSYARALRYYMHEDLKIEVG